MVDTGKVKVRMGELQIAQKDIANELGISSPSVSLKLNNKRPLYLDEAKSLAALLQTSEKEFKDFFLT